MNNSATASDWSSNMHTEKDAKAATPAEIASKTTKATSLMDLPPEIRNEIYELALSHEEAIFLYALGKLGHSWEQPALTRTSTSIRRETLPLFYGCNVFKANFSQKSISMLVRLLSTIGPSNLKLLRRFQVPRCEPDFQLPDAYISIPDLERGLEAHRIGARVEDPTVPRSVKMWWATVSFEEDASEAEWAGKNATSTVSKR